MVLEWVGFIGGFLIAISLMPQLIKTWKTKSTKDISLLWTIILLIGLLFYAVYAIKNLIVPLIIFALLEAIMSIILISFKLKYK